MAHRPIYINGERLWESLEMMGRIGHYRDTGVRRLALTDEDKAARDLFVEWAVEAGCSVEIDCVGNIFARRSGSERRGRPICMGSHLDTQIAGGRYDGVLGVLAGLEVIRALNDRSVVTRLPIEVAVWTNEEGARFRPGMQGSAAFAGRMTPEQVLASRDPDGAIFGDELARIGYAGSLPAQSRVFDSYFELHIEQAPELDRSNIDVGIVVGGLTAFILDIAVTGENAHCGPTPMEERRNAAVGAARIATAVDDIGWKYASTGGKSTTTHISCSPGLFGIIPDQARVLVDVRHPEMATAQLMRDEVLAAVREISQLARVDIEQVGGWELVDPRFDSDLITLLKSTADALALPWTPILSQAGHDAYQIARLCPTAMIFTPCRDGITHNVREEIELTRTLPGVNLLLNAVIHRAGAVNRSPV